MSEVLRLLETTLTPAVIYLLQNYYGSTWEQRAKFPLKQQDKQQVWEAFDILTIVQDNWATAFAEILAPRHLKKLPKLWQVAKRKGQQLQDATTVEAFIEDIEPIFDIPIRAHMQEESYHARVKLKRMIVRRLVLSKTYDGMMMF